MIYKKLQTCRVELQNKKLKKSGENKFAKFKYFELADFLPTVNELFEKHGLFSNFSIDNGLAKLVITDCDDETCQIFTSPVADADVKGCTAIQSLGAVHTYLKRYLYLNALEIVENDALDASVGSKEFEPVDKDEKIFNALREMLTSESAYQFYKANENKVKDLKKLQEVYKQVYSKLKKQETQND